jgi:hypothetical protein
MTTDQMRKAIHAEPFRPFTIHMADGRSYKVPHREFISQSPGGRVVMLWDEMDAASIIDLLLVVEIRTELANPGKGSKRTRGNGSH